MRFLSGVVVGGAAVALWRSGAAAWLGEHVHPIAWVGLGVVVTLGFVAYLFRDFGWKG